MTNLSILAKLSALERSGRLLRYAPTIHAAEQGKRRLFLTPEAQTWCFPAQRHPEGIDEEALAKARYLLNSFVLGRELEERFDLKRLDKYTKEVWEFRSHFAWPGMQLRLFGWFPQPNHFIVVHGKRRKDLEQSRGPKWNRAIQRVVDVRQALLPDETLYHGVSYADYVN